MVLDRLVRAALYPVSLLYAIASCIDARRRVARSIRVARPVVSVGNISAGGSGKTPLVALLAERLQQEGPVVILSRGYGRRDATERIWQAGEPLPDPELFGDEPALLARTLHDGAIAVGPDRATLAVHLAPSHDTATFLLDDGFQHRQLARDVDIVVVDDATASPPHDLIPAGRLREPPHALERADLLVAMSDGAAAFARAFLPADRVYRGRVEPIVVRHARSGNVLPFGSPIVLVTGIARSERVVRSAGALGLRLECHLSYRDHVRYDRSHVEAILQAMRQAPDAALVTTAKDAVKLERFDEVGDRLHILEIALRIDDEERFLRAIRDGIARPRHC